MSCGCTADVCACFAETSNTVQVIGSGGSGDPYVMSVIPAPSGGLENVALGVAILLDPDDCNILSLGPDGLLGQVITEDSATVNFSGCGTADDPITAEVNVGVDGLSQFLPGDIMMTAAATAGAGWVMCDGTFYDSVADPTKANLYAAIGTAFGGTGPDNFAVPPSESRSPMGAGTGVGEDNSGAQGTAPSGAPLATRLRGDWLGSQDVALSVANLAQHDHPIPDHFHTMDHDHVSTNNADVDAGMGTIPGADAGMDYTICTALGGGIGIQHVEASAHAHDIPPYVGNTGSVTGASTDDTGSGTAHQTIHPCFVVNFKIKL